MRVSSNMLFDNNVTLLNQLQSRLLQSHQQISSGRKMFTASDDPVGATQVLELSQSEATNTQYASNRGMARDTLSLAESTLQGVTSLLQDVREAAVGAGSSPVSMRNTLASNLSGRLQELVGLANSTDGLGNYLFSGFQFKTQPFSSTAAGVAYSGDDGLRNVQVSASRQMATSETGADLFMRIRSGNGSFVTGAESFNTGTGVISTGSLIDPALLTGSNYSVTFNVFGGVATYDVMDTTTGWVIYAGEPYVSGQAISFDGMQFDIKGVPANGDTFTVIPSTNESIFETLSNIIGALNASAAPGANPANLTNSLTHGIKQLDNALNNVMNVRAAMGLRLNEIDALDVMGDDMDFQFKKALSDLRDVDYNTAITRLSQQNLSLQAAQASFAKISSLSLFDYI